LDEFIKKCSYLKMIEINENNKLNSNNQHQSEYSYAGYIPINGPLSKIYDK